MFTTNITNLGDGLKLLELHKTFLKIKNKNNHISKHITQHYICISFTMEVKYKKEHLGG